MTERNEMPTPVPMWLKELAYAEYRKTVGKGHGFSDTATLWSLNTACAFTIARLLWERGEREPVDPDIEIAREIVLEEDVMRTRNQVAAIKSGQAGYARVALVLAGIKRGRELAEAKP